MKVLQTASTLANIVNAFTGDIDGRPYVPPFNEVRAKIPGWSNAGHYAFFLHALEAMTGNVHVCVCGVFQGLDCALVISAARALGKTAYVVGVDRFEDAPCDDWTPEMKARKTWGANGIGLAPSLENSRENVPAATFVKSDSDAYLAAHPGEFDLVYLDTSHDEATVRREIPVALAALKPGGLLCGDDYYEPGTKWGVDRAVQALLPGHVVFFNRIWAYQKP